MNLIRSLFTKRTLIGIGVGQFVSMMITSTGFSSSQLARSGIDAPTFQSFSNYVLLLIVYGSILIYRRKKLESRWYYFIVFAIFDVEGNFLVNKAYQYTAMTSVMLLDCWTIPCVIFLTWFFLKTKYRYKKFAGVAICVVGLVIVVFSDVHSADRSGGSHPIRGDLIAIAGATLYGLTNVSEEFLVKKGSTVEVLAMLGLFGAIVSACQIAILERAELQSIHWSSSAVLPFAGYALAMFLFYSSAPTLLKLCGSTMLNLSLLTSDMWAVLIRIFAYHEKVDWLYFIAFAVVAVGLIVYSWGSNEDEAEAGIETSENLADQRGVKDTEFGLAHQRDEELTFGRWSNTA